MVSAAQRQLHQIATWRAMAIKNAAHNDLRDRGADAMQYGKEAFRAAAATEPVPANIVDLVPRHDPHPYWNPTESDRRDPHYLGNKHKKETAW